MKKTNLVTSLPNWSGVASSFVSFTSLFAPYLINVSTILTFALKAALFKKYY
jgi:hypothetical protein